MKTVLPLMITVSLLSSVVIPGIAVADMSLLILAQQRSAAAGQDAKAKQADLAAKANADVQRAKQKAIDLGEEVARKIKDQDQDLAQDLIDGKAALVSALSCQIKNTANNLNQKVTVRTDAGGLGDRVLLPLQKLFPDDKIRSNEAISFGGSMLDDSHVELQLLDLSDNNRVIRSGKLADLNLTELTEDCTPSREIVYLNKGKVAINTQTTAPKDVLNQAGGAVVVDLKEIAQTATSAK
jgi:hypothetical protein